MKYFARLILLFALVLSTLADAQKVGNSGNYTRQQLRTFIDNLLPIAKRLIFNDHRKQLFAILELPLDIFDLNATKFPGLGSYLVLLPKKNSENDGSYCLIASTQTIQSVLDQKNISGAVRSLILFHDRNLPDELRQRLADTFDQAKKMEEEERRANRDYDTTLISPSCDYETR